MMWAAWVACSSRETFAPVDVSAVPLEDGAEGHLAWRAAFELRAADRAWGGWSGAALDGDTLWAVSDRGDFLSLRLGRDSDGRLTELAPVARGSLSDPAGRPLEGKSNADAEGLARDGSGFFVSFERDHRVQRYRTLDGRPIAVALPDGFDAPNNAGIEALAWARERLWIVAEGGEGGTEPPRAWTGGPGAWMPFTIPRTPTFRPVEWTPLPDGDLLLVERSFAETRGVQIRVSRIRTAPIVAGAAVVPEPLGLLRAPLVPMDNYEAAATDGRFLYLLSDDNQSSDQRTLLLQIEVLP